MFNLTSSLPSRRHERTTEGYYINYVYYVNIIHLSLSMYIHIYIYIYIHTYMAKRELFRTILEGTLRRSSQNGNFSDSA